MRSQGFDGCVRDLQFNVNKWDLNKNEAAKGVVRGCPEQVRNNVPGQVYISCKHTSYKVHSDLMLLFLCVVDSQNCYL